MKRWVSSLCDWEYIDAINQCIDIRRKSRFLGIWYKFSFRIIALNVSIGHLGGEIQQALVYIDHAYRLWIGDRISIHVIHKYMPKENEKKAEQSPSHIGSVDRALSCIPKGPRFDFSQGHVPYLRAPPWLGL